MSAEMNILTQNSTMKGTLSRGQTLGWITSVPCSNRFDTTIASWKGFNYLSFIVLILKKSQIEKV